MRVMWAEGRCWGHLLRWLWAGHCRFAGYDADGRLVSLGCVVVYGGDAVVHRVFYQADPEA